MENKSIMNEIIEAYIKGDIDKLLELKKLLDNEE